MCVDCRVINNIMVKYRHLNLRLNDMLDELYGSCMFYKIDQRNGFTSFYKRFIKNFSTLTTNLTKIVQKSMGFKWGK